MKRKQSQGGGGDGVAWLRGPLLGKGGFGSVYLANSRNRNRYFPQLMAVKSAEVSVSSTLQKEREVLNNLQGCPNILRCYGEETTTSEDGTKMVYNVLLEYASGGTLADLIKKSNGCGLQESDVKRYTKCILMGLNHIHECGYVHCDLKPENILLVPSKSNGSKFVSKIGDFGLAKRSKLSKKQKFDPYLMRGTTMYLAPEAVVDHVQEPPSDIWALGCVVLEMLTGKPTWDMMRSDYKADDLMHRIGDKYELPKIPTGVSKEVREFLKGCFVKNPMFRLTAEMLSNHPFVQGLDEINELEEVSDGALDINFSFTLYKSDDDDEDDDEFNPSSFSDDWSFTQGDSQISSCPEDEECVNFHGAEEETWRELKRKKLFTDDNVNCFVNMFSIHAGL